MSAAIDRANRLVELRSGLADWMRPMTMWELANSRRLRGAILCSAAMAERGIADLLAAWETCGRLMGASAEALRGEVSGTMYWAAAKCPHVAASVDWPALPGEMDDDDFAVFVNSAVRELDQKEKSLEEKYKFDLSARWMFEPDPPTLKFFDKNDKLHLTCDVIEIGSYAPPTQSWIWGWSNESITPKMREQALPLKQLQQITGKDYFGFGGPFSADEIMAWQLAAISVRHLCALGCYPAKYRDGRLIVFLAYVNVRAEP